MSLKNPVTPPGIDPGTFRLVAQRLNQYATPGPVLCVVLTKYLYVPAGFRREVDENCDVLGYYAMSKCKGKAVPLQAWSGPEGFRKLRFPDFMTTAQDGGKVVSLTHRPPLPPGNTVDPRAIVRLEGLCH
jgi:hypothetical protein